MFKRIFGVHVLVDAFKDFKSFDALKKEAGKIFEHLKEDADKAYTELWSEISPKENKPTVTPVAEPVKEASTTNVEASNEQE